MKSRKLKFLLLVTLIREELMTVGGGAILDLSPAAHFGSQGLG